MKVQIVIEVTIPERWKRTANEVAQDVCSTIRSNASKASDSQLERWVERFAVASLCALLAVGLYVAAMTSWHRKEANALCQAAGFGKGEWMSSSRVRCVTEQVITR